MKLCYVSAFAKKTSRVGRQDQAMDQAKDTDLRDGLVPTVAQVGVFGQLGAPGTPVLGGRFASADFNGRVRSFELETLAQVAGFFRKTCK